MRKPFVLVVVPFKNQTNLVVNFLNSIMTSYVSGFSYTVILWDDGSDERELNWLWNTVPKDMLILKHNNVGYTQTAYDIVEFAKTQENHDFLLLVNSDIMLEKGTFHATVKRALSNPNCAVVGGKILEYNGDKIIHTGTRVENGKITDPYCELHRSDSKTNFVERRLWVNGCYTYYNLDILRKENLNFDLDFKPCYFEEADLMTRLNMLGYSILYEPRAIIHHKVNASHNSERKKYENVFWTNWNKYLSKWKPYFESNKLQF